MVIRFVHSESSRFAELVPATNGHWYIWWSENAAVGTAVAARGCRKRSTLAVAWFCLLQAEKNIYRRDSEFYTFDSSTFGHFEPGAPWEYNAALFDSYEQYLELGLGIRKRAS